MFRELLGVPPLALAVDPRRPAPPGAAARLEAYLARRRLREPAQYILGRSCFFGFEFACRPGALIPRPETELLVEAALAELPAGLPARFLEIGVGSGCVTGSILALRPAASAVATDRSSAALALARENLAALGVADRAELVEADLYAGADRFPLVVSNPPYIPTAELARLERELAYEPTLALDGGPDGLDVIRRILAAADGLLLPGGILLLETGHDQEAPLAALARERGLALLGHARDLCGRPRIARLQSRGAAPRQVAK